MHDLGQMRRSGYNSPDSVTSGKLTVVHFLQMARTRQYMNYKMQYYIVIVASNDSGPLPNYNLGTWQGSGFAHGK